MPLLRGCWYPPLLPLLLLLLLWLQLLGRQRGLLLWLPFLRGRLIDRFAGAAADSGIAESFFGIECAAPNL